MNTFRMKFSPHPKPHPHKEGGAYVRNTPLPSWWGTGQGDKAHGGAPLQRPILETKNLAIGYTTPRKPPFIVAENIELRLHAGEIVCLIGPNGAGKSTLIRTLAGMQKPLHGKVDLLGDDIHQLTANELAQRVSVVLTEHPDVGLLTGYALVALGRHPYTDWTGKLAAHDEEVVRWAVDAVDAAGFAARAVGELSDGQRQKIMIARALAQEPALMILDEPTAFLDLPRRVETMRLLKNLTRTTNRTILLSTHDLDLALRTADRIWLLAQGGALHVGAPEDLVLSGTFEAAFRSEGVTFDVQTGSFQINQQQTGDVILIGDGIPFIWTRRALEREGFAVLQQKQAGAGPRPAPTTVEIITSSDQPFWLLHHPEQPVECHSVEALIAELRDSM